METLGIASLFKYKGDSTHKNIDTVVVGNIKILLELRYKGMGKVVWERTAINSVKPKVMIDKLWFGGMTIIYSQYAPKDKVIMVDMKSQRMIGL